MEWPPGIVSVLAPSSASTDQAKLSDLVPAPGEEETMEQETTRPR